MKKLFVILLAVALTLSLAAMASAATFDPYVGGEFQLTYTSQSATNTAPMSLGSGNNSMMKAYVKGKVEDADTNTWAQIGAKLTCWNNKPTVDSVIKPNDATHTVADYPLGYATASVTTWELLYSAGIKKVGGILDIQFSTDDYEATLRGQTPLNSGAFKFGGDPYFCNRLGNSFGFDVNADNITVNIGTTAGINGVNELGKQIVAAGTFKMEAGKVYVGYAKLSDVKSNMIVGAEMKLAFGTLKADYYGVNDTTATNPNVSSFQANVSFDEAKVNATLLYDMKNRFQTTDNSFGVGAEYTGIENLTLGAKYFAVQPDASYEVYGIIKAGVFDIRPGYAKDGAADGYVYLAAHVGMW